MVCMCRLSREKARLLLHTSLVHLESWSAGQESSFLDARAVSWVLGPEVEDGRECGRESFASRSFGFA